MKLYVLISHIASIIIASLNQTSAAAAAMVVSDNPNPKPQPRKIVTYPISGDDNGGALYIFGDTTSSKIAIMSAGFPDDQHIFCPLANRLATETDTLVGVTCIPGFDDREDKSWTTHKKEGYTWDEMVHAFREAVKVLRSESTYACTSDKKKEAELVGIFHDWAVVPGLMWCNRAIAENESSSTIMKNINAPDKIVLLDVCMGLHPDMKIKDRPAVVRPSIREEFIAIFYRSCFAWNYLTQRYLGNTAAYIVAQVGITFMRLFHLSPTFQIDSSTPVAITPSPHNFYKCYPYYQMFKSFISRGGLQDFKDATLPKDLKKTPCLFMYGMEKRIQFIDDYSVLNVLQREYTCTRREGHGRSKSNAIAVEGAGHWLYREDQEFDLCFDEVKKFIE